MLNLLALALLSLQDPRKSFDAPSIVLDPVWVPHWGDAGRFTEVGDFDGNGKPDLIGEWGFHDPGTWQVVKIWFGDGSGGIARRWEDPFRLDHLGQRLLIDGFVAVGVFGQPDAQDDFIHAYVDSLEGVETSVVRIFKGSPTNPILFQTLRIPGRLLDVELGDWDGNGTGDPGVLLIQPDGKRALRLLLNVGTIIDLPLPPGAWSQLETGEFTGGGGTDLALVSPAAVVIRALESGRVAALVPATVQHGLVSPDSAAGDIDGDGRDDVVLFTRAGYRVLRQRASGRMELGALELGGPATELADIDGDGDLDGICCGGGGAGSVGATYDPYAAAKFELAVNDGSGRFSPSISLPGLASEHIAGAIDFDRDGLVDLVAGRVIYFNPGEIRPPLDFPIELPGLMPASIGDIDGDGDPDFELSLDGRLLNEGDGRARAVIAPMPLPPAGATFTGPGLPGDFDQDGTLDLLVESSGSSTGLHLLRNQGGGSFVDAGAVVSPPLPYAGRTALDARSCRVLDIDGDGDNDLLVRADASVTPGTSQFIDVWLNQGSVFAASQSFVGESLYDLADLDSDGILDLSVLQCLGEFKGNLHWRPGLGNGAFGQRQLISQGEFGYNFEVDDEPTTLTLPSSGAKSLIGVRPGAGAFRYERTSTAWVESSLPRLLGPSGGTRVKSWFRAADLNLDGFEDLLSWPVAGGGAAFGFSTSAGLPTSGARLLMEPRALFDVDGDGDLDALSSRGVVLNRTSGASSGARHQFGYGCPGTGGVVPTLGATGPFVPGATIELRVRGARGGAEAVLVSGRTRAERTDWPVAGVTSWVDPTDAHFETVRLTLEGPAGVAGTGSATLSFDVPHTLAGVHEYYQVWIHDPGVPAGWSASQGLELAFGAP